VKLRKGKRSSGRNPKARRSGLTGKEPVRRGKCAQGLISEREREKNLKL